MRQVTLRRHQAQDRPDDRIAYIPFTETALRVLNHEAEVFELSAHLIEIVLVSWHDFFPLTDVEEAPPEDGATISITMCCSTPRAVLHRARRGAFWLCSRDMRSIRLPPRARRPKARQASLR